MSLTKRENKTFYIVLLALLFIISCSKKETPTPPTPPPPTPTNTSPVANFTVSPASGDVNTVFSFDASVCSDKETTMASLQVRWDYTNDGTFDTEWTTTKTLSGSFPDPGSYTVKLEVKDAGGLTASTTKSISVESGAFTDARDGSVYNTITVDGITWMENNLAYEIPGKQITDASAWSSNSTYDAWTYYDNDKDTYGDLYGILYQFEAAIAAIPDGWHLPTELEIRALTESLGGASIAGGALKEMGTDHWTAPNTGATNSSGYTGLPGGFRDENGAFSDVGDYGAYWTSTIYTLLDAWFWYLSYDESSVSWFSYPKTRGFTIRAVKDQDNNTAPTANFTVSPTTGDVNTEFTLDASTSTDNESEDSDLNVRWDFDNDGTFDTEWSTTKTVSHTYTAKGTYTAKVEVEDDGGLTGSTTQTIVVSDAAAANTAPTASFTISPSSGDTSTNFVFDASASSDTETATADLQVRWDFNNDGTFDVDWTTTKTTNLTYSAADTYTVKVEVKDEGGLVSTETKTVVVGAVSSNTAPTASFTISPTSGDTSTAFAFDASASSDTETATADLQVRWDFDNDGTFDVDWSTTKTTTHTYATADTYTVKVEVKDEGGLVGSKTETVVVAAANNAPTASFTIDPTSGDTDTYFSFDASASSDTETADEDLLVRWIIEGGNTSLSTSAWTTEKTRSEVTLGNIWDAIASDFPMDYSIKLEVKDSDGLTSSQSKEVVIEASVYPNAKFTVSPEEGYIWTEFTFDATDSWDGQTAYSNLRTIWCFDFWESEDLSLKRTNVYTDPINALSTNHTYNAYPVNDYDTPYFAIQGRVMDEDGNLNRTITSNLSVKILPNTDPTASFTISQSTALENTNISFDASGSTDDESISDSLYVRWDYENDGTYDTEWTKTKTTSHAYSSIATHTVKMLVRDQGGLLDSLTSTVDVIASTYTDSRDNETYNLVAIGEQIWFAENLNYEISGKEITDNSAFQNNDAYDGWSYYDNDKVTNGATYGILYQWEAAKIACPSGWHLSSDAEWKTLEVFLGMPQAEANAGQGSARTVAGTKLRSTSGWYSTGNGTNSSGFTALPAGARTDQFYSLTYWGYWWTSSEGNSSSEGWSRAMEWSGIDYIQRNGSPKYYGQSVRCLKDE